MRAGLITVREVTDRAVELRGSALLLHGQPIAYARPRSVPGALDAADRELRTLRLLAETGLVPEVCGHGDVTWTAAVRGERLGAVGGTMAELAEICQGWGAAIATLHLTRIAAASEPPVAPRPWVLDPDRLPRTMRQAPAGSARAFVLRTLRGDRGLQRTVLRVADRWSADHWTHGDLTEDRIRVQHSPDLRVRFVDLRGRRAGRSRLGPERCPRDGGRADRRPAGAVGPRQRGVPDRLPAAGLSPGRWVGLGGCGHAGAADRDPRLGAGCGAGCADRPLRVDAPGRRPTDRREPADRAPGAGPGAGRPQRPYGSGRSLRSGENPAQNRARLRGVARATRT